MPVPDLHGPDELKTLVEEGLERLDLWPELHGQATSVRYALEVGGKRVRPVIALAVGEALGAPVEQVMPAALAIELVHTFSLVHDDLPAMDDDEERRGHPSTWKKFGEGVGVLAGDALLAEAVRLAARYESSAVARELAEATLGMIGGQYLDTMVDGYDLAAVHRLKTGRLFYGSVTMALWAAELPEEEQTPWRAFAEELGLLFQIVDDILDADGYVREHGAEGARRFADEAAERARGRLAEVAVASGKGGVGKSTVSLNLARALADSGRSVGLLDADVYGPDIPLMLGIKRTRELRSWLLGRDSRYGRVVLEPVERLGVKVMSVGFLLAEHQAMTMPGQLVDLVARQLIEDVAWGDLDYLIVDLPPGTADLQQQLFERSRLAGAIVVVGPQDATHLDARRLVTML